MAYSDVARVARRRTEYAHAPGHRAGFSYSSVVILVLEVNNRQQSSNCSWIESWIQKITHARCRKFKFRFFFAWNFRPAKFSVATNSIAIPDLTQRLKLLVRHLRPAEAKQATAIGAVQVVHVRWFAVLLFCGRRTASEIPSLADPRATRTGRLPSGLATDMDLGTANHRVPSVRGPLDLGVLSH